MSSVRGRPKIRPPKGLTLHPSEPSLSSLERKLTLAMFLDLKSLSSPGINVDFDKMWTILASALREIHTKNSSELSYEELYRNAYKLVLKKKGEALYNKVKQFEEAWLSGEVRSRVRSATSSTFFSGPSGALVATSNERRVAGERFLRAMREAWEDHRVCTAMIADVLMYMDRVYCADNRKPIIYIAIMGLFRDQILHSPLDAADADSPKISSILNSVILDQIQMERDGDIVDRNLIRSCIYMLEGLYVTDAEHENQKLYLITFEPEFVRSSRLFYKEEAEKILRQADAATFLRHTQKRLEEEDARCESTLSTLTGPKIRKVIEEEVIAAHIGEVINMEGSGAEHMLDNDRFDELQLMFDLVARVDARKEALAQALRKRVEELGVQINNASGAVTGAGAATGAEVDNATADAGAKPQGQGALNMQTAAAIQWVDDVLRLKDKYETVWTRSFSWDHELQTSLTRGFTTFINDFKRSPEYISLFIDENLRRGLKGKTEAEAEQVLEKAVVLLRYVQDKDLFERYYKKHLSKRLLAGRSVSHEVERQMISKMKLEIGNYFTQKLEGMFKDMAISEGLTSDFRGHTQRLNEGQERSIELGVHVLTSTFWPMDALGYSGGHDGAPTPCVFPDEIERVKENFQKFYLNRHNGRRLTWQANTGSADIKAIFPAVSGRDAPLNRERKHEINVSTYAMMVLLLFNDLPRGASIAFEEIEAKTMIPTSDLIRNLQSLAVAPKTRILIKEPMSKDIKPSDRFAFNEGFSSKFLKFKVGVVAGANKVEGERERKDTEKRNDEMRGGIIEAAVVRIMKGRKKLSHQNLLSEIISQLANRFAPDMAMVKKRIESLIDREYLERIEGSDPPSYRYLA